MPRDERICICGHSRQHHTTINRGTHKSGGHCTAGVVVAVEMRDCSCQYFRPRAGQPKPPHGTARRMPPRMAPAPKRGEQGGESA